MLTSMHSKSPIAPNRTGQAVSPRGQMKLRGLFMLRRCMPPVEVALQLLMPAEVEPLPQVVQAAAVGVERGLDAGHCAHVPVGWGL